LFRFFSFSFNSFPMPQDQNNIPFSCALVYAVVPVFRFRSNPLCASTFLPTGRTFRVVLFPMPAAALRMHSPGLPSVVTTNPWAIPFLDPVEGCFLVGGGEPGEPRFFKRSDDFS
jgi:hypothetical protein